MALGAPYTDIRIERPARWDWIVALPGLISIDLQPYSTGPEIELTFGTAEGCDPAGEEFLCKEVERVTNLPTLASRQRINEPGDGMEIEPPGWFERAIDRLWGRS